MRIYRLSCCVWSLVLALTVFVVLSECAYILFILYMVGVVDDRLG